MPPENVDALPETRIRALIDDWAKAMRAKDVEGVMAHYAEGSVTFDLAPPLISTGANAAGLEAWFATWTGPIGYQVRDLRVVAGQDTAFSHGLTRLRGMQNDGEQVDMWFRQTLGLRQIGASGRSRTSTNPCRSTWTAATAPRLTSSRDPGRWRRRNSECGQAQPPEIA